MYKMIYMGSLNNAICEYLLKMKAIKIVGVIADKSMSNEKLTMFRDFWKVNNIPEINLCEADVEKADFVLVNGYSRIIKSDLIQKYLFVNIHAGNLPKWRGTSANSWAILNGDNKIAYTLHKITSKLDDGPIYYKYEYDLPIDKKYGDGRKMLEALLLANFEDELIEICKGNKTGEIQNGRYVYCSPFRKEDGYITTWNKKSIDFINLFRVFGTPYGSGLYLQCKNEWYEILDICIDECFAESNLVPGAVVYKYSGNVWIKTADTAVKINRLKDTQGNMLNAVDIFKIGMRL